MKCINKYYFLIFLIFFSYSNSFSFGVNDRYEKYCFNKYVTAGDQITLSFVITSYPKELINADFTYSKEKHSTKAAIYQVTNKDSGNYKSQNPKEGYYELCFYSKKGKEYQVSMEFYTLFEEHNLKEMATDKDFKNINKDVQELKNDIEKMQANARHLIDRKYWHNSILSKLTNSIKRLTYLKMFCIAVLSIFQIYVVQKFFGPDKRVSSIKGAFSDKSIL